MKIDNNQTPGATRGPEIEIGYFLPPPPPFPSHREAALWARAANEPFDTWPPPAFAVAPWMRDAAANVIGE